MCLRIGLLPIVSTFAFAVLASSPGFAETLAVDANGCLHVTEGPSGTCDPKSKSLKVELTNTCKKSISAQVCIRGANHLWVSCAASDKLATGEKFFGSSCESEGDYTFWGCSQTSASATCGGTDLVGKGTNTQK